MLIHFPLPGNEAHITATFSGLEDQCAYVTDTTFPATLVSCSHYTSAALSGLTWLSFVHLLLPGPKLKFQSLFECVLPMAEETLVAGKVVSVT